MMRASKPLMEIARDRTARRILFLQTYDKHNGGRTGLREVDCTIAEAAAHERQILKTLDRFLEA